MTIVTRWRRAAVMAGCAIVPLLCVIFVTLSMTVINTWNLKNPGIMDLNQLLSVRSAMHRFGPSARTPEDKHFAVYIAKHYQNVITNEAAWNSPMSLTMIKGDARKFAEQSVLEHPESTGNEIEEAEKVMKPYAANVAFADIFKQQGFLLMIMGVTLVVYVALPALLAALLFRGGLILRIANVTFARRDGKPASRGRLFWRAMVAWMPAGLVLVVCLPLSNNHPILAQAIACCLVGGLAIVSTALPVRGLQDRLSGTWPVPR